MNFLQANLAGGTATLAAGGRLPASGLADTTGLFVGLRPEHFVVGGGPDLSFPFHVDVVEYLGGTRYLHGTTASNETLVIEARDALQTKPGDDIRIGASASRALLFATSGARLRVAA